MQATLRGVDGDGWTLLAGRGGDGAALSYVGENSTALCATLPVASAAKWVSGAVIMRLVQEGMLSLDDTVQRWLPSWTVNSSDGRDAVRLRHLLSMTSGIADGRARCDWALKGDGAALDAPAPLSRCVLDIAASTRALVSSPPGTVLNYHGYNLEVAGAMVEAATNMSWAALFARTVQRQLRAPARYTAGDGGFGPVEGMLIISAADYARFMSLVLAPSDELLNATTLRMMYSPEHTAQATLNQSLTYATQAPGWRYGFGMWLEDDGAAASSMGFFGIYPRLNLSSRQYAVLIPGGPMQREPAAVASGALMRRSVVLMRRIWAPLMHALADAPNATAACSDAAADADATRVAALAQQAELTSFGGACGAVLNRSRVDVTVHSDYSAFVLAKPDVVSPNGTIMVHAFADRVLTDFPAALVPYATGRGGPPAAGEPFQLAASASPRIWLKLKRASAVARALGCSANAGDDAITAAAVNAALLPDSGIEFAPDERTRMGPEWLGAAVTVTRAPDGGLRVRCPSLVTAVAGPPPPLAGSISLKVLSPQALQALSSAAKLQT